MLSEVLSVEVEKMSETRRPLGSLASEINVEGEDSVEEESTAGGDTIGPPLRGWDVGTGREEAWRPLTKRTRGGLYSLFVLAFGGVRRMVTATVKRESRHRGRSRYMHKPGH